MPDTTTLVLDLVQRALDELDSPGARLSSVIRKAIRVARLRRDYDSLYWLAMEMRTIGDEEAKKDIYYEVAPHLTRAALETLHKQSIGAYIARRSSAHLEFSEGGGKGGVLSLPVPEIEVRIENLREGIRDLTTPTTLSSSEYLYLEERQGGARAKLHLSLTEWTAILQRISQAIYDYLSRTEQQLYFGQANSDIFEQNRLFVHDRLRQLFPTVLEQFVAAADRFNAGGPESGSHVLVSCRRILKSLADHLYPARAEPVTGSDGKERTLGDEKYLSRLRQYVHEAASGSASRKLLSLQVDELGARIERLNELASKGVHADVGMAEVHQCVLQTYLLLGDLLRLHEGNSALIAAEAEIDKIYPEPAPNQGPAADGMRRR